MMYVDMWFYISSDTPYKFLPRFTWLLILKLKTETYPHPFPRQKKKKKNAS